MRLNIARFIQEEMKAVNPLSPLVLADNRNSATKNPPASASGSWVKRRAGGRSAIPALKSQTEIGSVPIGGPDDLKLEAGSAIHERRHFEVADVIALFEEIVQSHLERPHELSIVEIGAFRVLDLAIEAE
jgi:hypothetical protein